MSFSKSACVCVCLREFVCVCVSLREFVCVCVCLRTHVLLLMLGSGTIMGVSSFLHYVGSGNQTLVFRLGSKHLYLPSHLEFLSILWSSMLLVHEEG